MKIRITAPGWAHGRTGTARPWVIGRGYHVQLDGDHSRTDYAFKRDEFEVTP